MRRLTVTAALAALLALAFVVRVVPTHPTVFPGGDSVRLLGVDAYYHLRHTQYCVKHYPHVQRWDVGTSYPVGQRAKAAGLHDVTMATVAKVAGLGNPSPATVARSVAWTPPALGVLALLALFALMRRVAGPRAGLLACALASIYPGGFLARTALGYADHHASEILWAMLALLGVFDCLKRAYLGRSTPNTSNGARDCDPPGAGGSASRWSKWLRALCQAAPMAVLFFTWLGAPLHLFLVGTGIFGVLLLVIARGRVELELGKALLRYGCALLLLVGGPSLLMPDLIMIPSVLPEATAALLILTVGPIGVLWVARALEEHGVRNRTIALGFFALVLFSVFSAVTFVPGVRSALGPLVDPKHPLVAEHIVFDLRLFWVVLGAPGFVALTAPIVCAIAAYRRRELVPAFFVSLVGLALGAVWWRTHDYDYAVPLFSALLATLSLWILWRSWLRNRRVLRYFVAVSLAAAVVLPIWPLRDHPPPWPLPEQIGNVAFYSDGWAEAMDWMAHETPEPSLAVDARVPPWEYDFQFPAGTYGIIAAWDVGNIIAAMGRRVPVASQGVSESVAAWMLLDSESAALSFWEPRLESGEQIRYVVLDAETLGARFAGLVAAANRDMLEFVDLEGPLPMYGEGYEQTIAAKLYLGAGKELTRYRLVYQSSHQSALYHYAWSATPGTDQWRFGLRTEAIETAEDHEQFERLQQAAPVPVDGGEVYGGRIVPTVRIFEVVTGAVLTGTVAPESTVQAHLLLQSNSGGGDVTYCQTVQADTTGRFSLTLPYSTDGLAPADVQAASLYGIYVERAGGFVRAVRIGVSEDFVQSGETLDLGRIDG